ncbi:hypothetical protein GCM10027612_39450 [Microbispora bryophytorum subsp. camponoti]
MTHAQTERAALCDLLDRLGPGAPTLCEGWSTEDLAAHLVLRERRLDAAPGIALPFLAGYTASVQDRITRSHSYPELVGLVRHGPPRWTPYGLVPRLDEIVNTIELFIHHEDVRRAQAAGSPASSRGTCRRRSGTGCAAAPGSSCARLRWGSCSAVRTGPRPPGAWRSPPWWSPVNRRSC